MRLLFVVASVRKKYNPAATNQSINALRQNRIKKENAEKLAKADKTIKELIAGATVAYNSTWETELKEGEEGRQVLHTTGLERLASIPKIDSQTAFGTLLEIVVRWRFYITINNETQDGEVYFILLPIIDRTDSAIKIIFDIQNNIIPAALEKRNMAHFKDWGYWGEIA